MKAEQQNVVLVDDLETQAKEVEQLRLEWEGSLQNVEAQWSFHDPEDRALMADKVRRKRTKMMMDATFDDDLGWTM